MSLRYRINSKNLITRKIKKLNYNELTDKKNRSEHDIL